MAVQPSAGRTVPLFVLIIFIVLFLASATGLVLLFVNQESIRQEAQQKSNYFETYMGQRMVSKLDTYKGLGSSMRPSKTAVEALMDERDQMALLLAGNKSGTSKEVVDKVKKMLDELPAGTPAAEGLKKFAAGDLVGALQKAASQMIAQGRELDNLKNEMKKVQTDRDTISKGYKDLESQFAAKTKQFLSQLEALQKLGDTIKKDFSDQIETVKSQVSKELQTRMESLQKNNLLRLDEMRDLVQRNLRLLIQATTELAPAEFRVASGLTVDKLIQEVDGEVLNVAGPVVYINVGTKDGIKPGIRIDVIPASMQGQTNPTIKGVLEVTATADLTSECRVVRTAPGEPITKGDLLVNLVFGRERKRSFFVLGDFDLNQDGMMDPDGAQRVARIIQSAGGKVSTQLSPAVNFVVVGAPPSKDDAGEPGSEAAAKKVRAFNDMKSQIQAMNIPVITPETFLKFTGYGK